MNNKKAAMFGLDARIALAIFGALSVISGAALYSAIQQSKVTGFVAASNEVFKAIESYMLDTGQDLPADDNHVRVRKFLELETSSLAGWQGPYVSFKHHSVSYSMIVYNSKNAYIEMLKSDIGGDTNSLDSSYVCASGESCYYWFVLINIEDSLAKAIDEYVDGVSGRAAGNVRLFNSSAAGADHVYIKGPRLLSQP
tara:strand:+ start:158 stop:748 length:591 start_codon:yes stop_codon:yes gene_type:complete